MTRRNAWGSRFVVDGARGVAAVLFVWSLTPLTGAAQRIHPDWADTLQITDIGSSFFRSEGRVTQMAMLAAPNPGQSYLYMASERDGIRRALYDHPSKSLVAGTLETVVADIDGLGVAFHGDTLYSTQFYERGGQKFSRLWRIEDQGMGTRTAIVQSIPRDDHGVNNLQVIGDSLYVGIGVRTRNGVLQTWSRDRFGESAYGGTIAMIEDLNAVGPEENAAGFFPVSPSTAEYEKLISGADVRGAMPFTSTDPGKLRIHSSGTRNPFGLAVDGDGQIWFTNNFHRVDNDVYDRQNLTLGADGDEWSGDGFQNDIHDQMFKATPFADYGYRNGHWQPNNPSGNTAAIDAGFFAAENRQASFTFDNFDDPAVAADTDDTNPAYNQEYDSDDPSGLGPSSSANGFDFYQGNDFPLSLHKDAFVARWVDSNRSGGDSATFRDVVAVDHQTGAIQRIATDFANPLSVLDDGTGNLIVSDYGGSLYLISAKTPAAAHEFQWSQGGSGRWSTATAWTTDDAAASGTIVPDQWGSAKYNVTLGPSQDIVVEVDQDVRLNRLSIGDTVKLDSDHVLSVETLDVGPSGVIIADTPADIATALSVNGSAQLSGTLALLTDDVTLVAGDPFTRTVVLTAGVVGGQFDSLRIGDRTADAIGHVGEGRIYRLEVANDAVTLLRYQALVGDVNFDQRFDSGDLVKVFVAGEYEDGIAGNSDWTEGDWDGDRDFGSSDLVEAFRIGHYDAVPAAHAVPEPTTASGWWLAVALLGLIRQIRPIGRIR